MPVITDFAKGMDMSLSPYDLPEGVSPYAKNVDGFKRTLKLRRGRTAHTALPAACTIGGRGLSQWLAPSGSVHPNRLVTVVGNKLYATNNAGQTYDGTELTMDCTVHSTNRLRFCQIGNSLYWVDSSNWVRKAFELGGAAENAVATLSTTAAPLKPPSIQALTGAAPGDFLALGDYIFATTYTVGGVESNFSKAVRIRIGDRTYRTLRVTAYNDGTLSVNPTGVRIYAMTPYRPQEWVYCYEFPYPTVPEALWVFDLLHDSLTSNIARQEYLAPPPKGATLIREHMGRMVCVAPFPGSSGKADTIFWGNSDDVEKFAISTYVNPPESYGTYSQIGNDNQEITGIFSGGNILGLLKKKGLWLSDGDSWINYRVEEFDQETGCEVHETIQRTDLGHMYLSPTGVHLFTGQRVEKRIGEPVQKLIDTLTQTQKDNAFAVYGPDKCYRLFFPSVAGAFGGVCLNYDTRRGLWDAFWDNQPSGMAIWAPGLNTRAIYAVDPNAAAKKVWRLNEGANDDGTAIAWERDDLVRSEPNHYINIDKVQVDFEDLDTTKNPIFNLSIRRNGSSTDWKQYVAAADLPKFATCTIATIHRNGAGTVTVSTTASHHLLDGQTAIISGTGIGLDGSFGPITVTGWNTFTYAQGGGAVSGTAGSVNATLMGPKLLSWKPAPQPRATGLQVVLSGSSNGNMEIRELLIDIEDKGLIS